MNNFKTGIVHPDTFPKPPLGWLVDLLTGKKKTKYPPGTVFGGGKKIKMGKKTIKTRPIDDFLLY